MSFLASYRDGLANLDRRARLVAIGSAVFVASRMSLVTFLGIYFVRERGLDAATVGAALLVESIARGVAAPFVGALSDRIGRKPLMLGHIAATALVLPMFLLVTGAPSLFLWSVVVGLAQGPYFTLSSALLLDLVPAERRQSALSVNYTAISIGFTLGVAPAGLLAARGFEYLAFASAVGVALVGLIYVFALRGPLPREAASARSTFASDTVRAFRDPKFLLFSLAAVVFPIGIGLVTVPIALFASDSGVSDVAIGLVLSLNGLIVVVLAVPVNARMERSGPYRFLPLAAIFLAACYLALAVSGTLGWFIVSVVAFSLGEIVFSSAAPTVVAALAPAGLRGAYQGAWSLLYAVGIGGAAFLAGLGRDQLGWSSTWAIAVAHALIAAAGLALLHRSIRRAQASALPSSPP